MRLKWFPSGVYEINTQNFYDATKMHKKNRRPYVCMRFSVYTEIKGSLRRWNCVCIEAFGFFNQRLLCCHGNACWTKVLWIFQQPPFLSNHLGSFHNPHNIQKFSWRGGRPVPSKLVKVSSQVSGTPSQYRFVASDGMNPMPEIKAQKNKKKQFMQKDTESTQMQRGQGSTMHAKKIFVHSWGDRSKHGNDLLLILSLCLFQQTMSSG